MAVETTTDYLVWTNQYSVGDDPIDQQHQQIVAILNQFYKAIREGNQAKQAEAIIDELDRYAKTHLMYEEDLMAEIGYPGLPEHRRKHGKWVAAVPRYRALLRTQGPAVGHDIFLMVKDWWAGHILGIDRLYVPYLRE